MLKPWVYCGNISKRSYNEGKAASHRTAATPVASDVVDHQVDEGPVAQPKRRFAVSGTSFRLAFLSTFLGAKLAASDVMAL